MAALVVIIAWMLCASLLIPLAIYSGEIAAGLVPVTRRTQQHCAGKVTILIPAHDEGAGIGATIRALRAVAPSGIDILVVADNCTDMTASLAQDAGARVVERQDPVRRGKGYALAFGRDHLSAAPPDVVVVVDADCRLAPGSIQRLASVTSVGGPSQAANLITPDRGAPALVQISTFAMLVKNLVRSRGLQRIGGCALLTGTGMAFPWKIFEGAPLESGDIAEDLGLGIALTRAGHSITLVEEARVQSEAASVDASVDQRTRWEHGFLRNAGRHALPALRYGVRTRSRSLFFLGLHLLVPPLALLLVLVATALAALSVCGFLSANWLPFLVLLTALGTALLLTTLAWLAYGRDSLTLRALLQAPLYMVWKLPIYLRLITGPETNWQRTRRKG